MQPTNNAICLGLMMGVLAGCGGGDNADDTTDATDTNDVAGFDAALAVDSAPIDAASGGLSDLTDEEWTALCMEIFTEEASFGQRAAFQCADADCVASVTAVEDCIDDLVVQPPTCEPPPANNPLRDCGAPVADLETCYGGFMGQFVPYADATCATVDELGQPNLDFETIAECDDLLALCPDVFQEMKK